MKFFSIILGWMIAWALVLTASSATRTQADPTDDFSFSLSHVSETKSYHLMPIHKVEQILRDRLDLFPKSLVPRLAAHIEALCKRYRFDPAFILALIQTESSFRVKAVSPMGAVGLMQIMPPTASIVARGWDIKYPGQAALNDPFTNITIGVTYLAWLRDRYRGLSPYYLVAAYNAGPGKIDEIISRKDFKPVTTKAYFEAIRRRVPAVRFYGGRLGV